MPLETEVSEQFSIHERAQIVFTIWLSAYLQSSADDGMRKSINYSSQKAVNIKLNQYSQHQEIGFYKSEFFFLSVFKDTLCEIYPNTDTFPQEYVFLHMHRAGVKQSSAPLGKSVFPSQKAVQFMSSLLALPIQCLKFFQ